MIDEIAVERVRLFCPEDHWQQEVDVDVVRYADPDGGLWEYFSIDGDPVMSPYTPDGRPLCPVCGRTTIPIAYGMPGPGLMELAERGVVRLGGCVIEDNQPTHECPAGHRSEAQPPEVPLV